VSKKPFHNPFAGLKRKLEEDCPAAAAATPTPPATSTSTPTSNPTRAPTDEELWAQATAGAKRVDRGPARVTPGAPRRGPEAFWHPDLEAIDQLRALVRGEAPFDLSDSDEFIEGRVTGLDPAVVRKLRRGEYAVQAHADLHGLTRQEAKAAADRFLRQARASGKRCVLLVHGRGIHSKDQVPVLKEALRSWLSTARFGRHVLAFATARPQDGGAGAVYVLLRRAGR